MSTKITSENKKRFSDKIVIFEEADGFHWNTQRSIDETGAYDATGKGYTSRRKAMQAAKNHIAQNAGL